MGNDAGGFAGEAEPRVRAELKRVQWLACACAAFFVLIAIGIGRYRSSLEIALLVLSNVASVGVVLWTARARRLDQSERRRTEQALAASEERFRHLAESGILGIIICDTAGNIEEANDEFLRIVGYRHDDVRSGKLRWTELTPPEWRALDEDAIQELGRSGAAKPWAKEYLRKDGTRVPVVVGVAGLGPERAQLGAERAVAFVL